MTLKPKIKLFTFTVLFCLNCLTGFSTVTGSVIIDIFGFDSVTKSIFFTRTDWGECNCQTELYTYRIDTDSLEIISDWSSRTEYSENRNEIIKNKRFANLAQPDTSVLPDFVLFKWEPEVKYYSKVLLAETVSCPFKLSIFGQDYRYYQCSKNSGKPEIVSLRIDEDSGLIVVKFQGDCFEGNWNDSLIYYSRKDGKRFSKKLTTNDVVPLEIYEMEKK
jgi:hypothetical protein